MYERTHAVLVKVKTKGMMYSPSIRTPLSALCWRDQPLQPFSARLLRNPRSSTRGEFNSEDDYPLQRALHPIPQDKGYLVPPRLGESLIKASQPPLPEPRRLKPFICL